MGKKKIHIQSQDGTGSPGRRRASLLLRGRRRGWAWALRGRRLCPLGGEAQLTRETGDSVEQNPGNLFINDR